MTTRTRSTKKTAAKRAEQDVAKASIQPKAIASRQTKAEILQAIADDTGLSRTQVAAVFGSLGSLILRHMKRRGSGEITIPDTGVKISRVRKPASKARAGRNPRTGEELKIPARPAHNAIKLTPLKALKDTLV